MDDDDMMDARRGEQVRLRVHDTEDFLSLVPYLLGYRPQEQLVFLGVEGNCLRVTGAMPLACFADPEQAASQLRSALAHFQELMVLLACWSEDDAQAEQALGMAEVWVGADHVIDSVRVGADEWHSRHGGRCGTAEDLQQTAVAAQAVVAGLSTATSRSDAVAFVAGPPLADQERLRPVLLAAQERLSVLARSERLSCARELHADALGMAVVDDHTVAQLMVLADEYQVCHALWADMRREHAAAEERLWRQVVALAPPRWAEGALLQLGFATWLSGSGAVLVECVDRLLQLDPWSESVALLEALNRGAVPPQAWEEVRDRWLAARDVGQVA